jgi:hypothetical protein
MATRIPRRFRQLISLFSLLFGLIGASGSQAQSYQFFRVLGPGGQQSNVPIGQVALAGNGQVLAFNNASGGVFGGGASGAQLVALDLVSASFSLASTTAGGAPSANATAADRPALSADGRYIAFETNSATWTGGLAGVHLVRIDRQSREARLLNLTTAGSLPGATLSALGGLSADGRFAVFTSAAAQLVSGDPGNSNNSVFVRDAELGLSERIDLAVGGGAGNGGSFGELPSISADGRYVAFASTATNLVSPPPANIGTQRIWLRDRLTQSTRLLSVGPGGVDLTGAGNAALSADGRLLVFRSNAVASGTSQLWVRRLADSAAIEVPAASGGGRCDAARISNSGLVIARCRQSQPGLPSQVYAWSLQQPTQPLALLSGSDAGNTVPGNGASGASLALSADGRVIAFESDATDLVSGDSNAATDVFVYLDPSALDALFADGFE